MNGLIAGFGFRNTNILNIAYLVTNFLLFAER